MARQILTGRVSGGDARVPRCFAFPQPVFQRQILEYFKPRVELLVGRALSPSYVYARIYLAGAELLPHIDRRECELTVTLAINSSEKNAAWPFSLLDSSGVEQEILLSQGDALLFDGRALLHWRRPLVCDWHAQLFLHYLWG